MANCSSLAWYNVAMNQIGSYSDVEDGKVLIYCNDDHLTALNINSGFFSDTSRPGTKFTLRPGMNKGCSKGLYAFGYPIFTNPKKGSGQPYYAIVLCKGYNGATLNSLPQSLNILQDADTKFEDLKVMSPASMMTGKILHEFIHAAGPINECKCLLSVGHPLPMI